MVILLYLCLFFSYLVSMLNKLVVRNQQVLNLFLHSCNIYITLVDLISIVLLDLLRCVCDIDLVLLLG